jgi:predicted phosphodiesterase
LEDGGSSSSPHAATPKTNKTTALPKIRDTSSSVAFYPVGCRCQSSRVLSARIGVIGDVHAEDALLEAAVAFLFDQSVGAILCTGDVVDGRGSAQRACELLREHDVVTVRGNHDRWFVEGTMRTLPDATRTSDIDAAGHAFLAQLPAQRELVTPAGSLLLCHGLGTNDMARLGADDFGYALEVNDDLQALLRLARHRWVINGHTHRRMVRRFGALTVINAGTLKRDNDPCVLIVDFTLGRAGFFDCANGAFSETPALLLPL